MVRVGEINPNKNLDASSAHRKQKQSKCRTPPMRCHFGYGVEVASSDSGKCRNRQHNISHTVNHRQNQNGLEFAQVSVGDDAACFMNQTQSVHMESEPGKAKKYATMMKTWRTAVATDSSNAKYSVKYLNRIVRMP